MIMNGACSTIFGTRILLRHNHISEPRILQNTLAFTQQHFHTLHTFTSLFYIYTYGFIFILIQNSHLQFNKLHNDPSSVEKLGAFTVSFYFKKVKWNRTSKSSESSGCSFQFSCKCDLLISK